MNVHKSLYIIVFALFLGISAPALFSDGMFMDGLLYATIGRNLAEGHGSFWNLYLSETFFPQFHEHPPLAMWLQSLLFRVFGDSIYVERFYSLSNYLITGYIMVLIWKKIVHVQYRSYGWLPLLFWMSIPNVTWAVGNNLLENTMMIFVSLSVLFMIKSSERNRFLMLFLAGIMLFLGFLSKGFVALFPWSFPFWWWLVSRKMGFWRMSVDVLVVIIATLLPFLLLYLWDYAAIESLLTYINKQVVGGITKAKTVDTRFFILYRVFLDSIPAILITGALYFWAYKKNTGIRLKTQPHRWALIFFALAMSGVIPIMVSMKQRSFYVLATLPFFGLAFGFLTVSIVRQLIQHFKNNNALLSKLRMGSYLLLAAGLVISLFQFGRIGRDEDMIEDVHRVIEVVHENAIIGLSKERRKEWSLYGYFARYGHVSLDWKKPLTRDYLLLLKNNAFEIGNDYEKIDVELQQFELFHRK